MPGLQMRILFTPAEEELGAPFATVEVQVLLLRILPIFSMLGIQWCGHLWKRGRALPPGYSYLGPSRSCILYWDSCGWFLLTVAARLLSGTSTLYWGHLWLLL